ncbi:MAG: bifunctional hydroxymethylpyrimidine kinase/phosphomethylpyrimidine kinase [Rhodospirillales bacterium]
MDVISLQSRVETGYVGNAVAEPVLRAIGVNVRPVDSVVLAHHPGHGPVTPVVTEAAALSQRLHDAIDRSSSPFSFLSGYLVNVAQGRAALGQLDRARQTGRLASYYLDPVFGDDAEGTYVDPGLVTFFRDEALPVCTVLMPNRYELSVLAGEDINSIDDAVSQARSLLARGPEFVLASSIPGPDGQIANVLIGRDHVETSCVTMLNLKAKGTGDLLSAAFCGLHAMGQDARKAMTISVELVTAAATDAAARQAVELDLPKILKNFDFSTNKGTGSISIETLEH